MVPPGETSSSEERGTHFIKARIEADNAAGTYDGRVATRFPPEPNGYLHIGHAKSICLNFGLAAEYGGTCNLRFDDTNPSTEDTEYVDAILRDLRWLGFEPSAILHASDYYEQLYAWAEQLIMAGKAYVDEQTLEEVRHNRGTVTEPGTPSPWRDRPPQESLDLFRRMKAGEFEDGSLTLRARIDMAHPNMLMRDPLMYRIRKLHHYRTGDRWSVYPMYDYAHGLSDALEGITHSLCTLEFENNRALYDWFVEAIGFEQPPQQIEFARLNLTYTVMSKRFLLKLVRQGRVDGWDDPRMPTLAGLRRRGVPPQALRRFAERVGVAKANSTVDLSLFEHTIREVLNTEARRRMAVYEPLEVVLTNWDADRVELLEAPDFPADVGRPGTRTVPLTKHLVIERGDFSEDPPKGWRRLVPGGEVRLRYGHVIRCDEVEHDADGQVVRLHCSVDHDTLGKRPQGRRVRGTVHWVSADKGLRAQIVAYDRLFTDPFPGQRTGDYMDDLNPQAKTVYEARIEPSVAEDGAGVHYQLERQGYAWRAPEDAVGSILCLNQVVPLKDRWAKSAEPAGPVRSTPEVVDPTANAEDQARIRAEARQAALQADAELQAAYASVAQVLDDPDDALRIARLEGGADFFGEAVGAGADAASAANWLNNVLAAELGDDDTLAGLPFDGAAFGRLVVLVDDDTLSTRLGKGVLGVMLAEGGDPEGIAKDRGWVQVSDADALQATVAEVLAGLPDEVARYQAGETRLIGFFMGQVMRATQGKANPAVVKPLIVEALG